MVIYTELSLAFCFAIYSNCHDFCYIFGVDFRDINVVLMPSVQVIQSTHILSFGMCMLALVLML